jgi:hypothetical protein
MYDRRVINFVHPRLMSYISNHNLSAGCANGAPNLDFLSTVTSGSIVT